MAWGIDLGFHNMLTCQGWATTTTNLGPVGFDFGSPCMMSKLGLVILFFIIAIVRKWGGEEMGVEFSFLWACVLGMLPYILVITFTGSTKLAMLVGIVGMLVGGYLAGMMFGGSGDNTNYG